MGPSRRARKGGAQNVQTRRRGLFPDTRTKVALDTLLDHVKRTDGAAIVDKRPRNRMRSVRMSRRPYAWKHHAERLHAEENSRARRHARRERVRAVLRAGAFVVIALLIGWPLAHVVFETVEAPPSLAAPEAPP